MFLLYSVLLLCFFLVDLSLILTRHRHKAHFRLNASLILIVSFYSYTAALPFSRLVLGTEFVPDMDNAFLIDNLLAALGITAGLAVSIRFAGLSLKANRGVGNPVATVTIARTRWFSCIIGAILVAALYYSLSQVDFNVARLAGAYGAENNINNDNVTVVDTLLMPLAICAVLHYAYASRVRPIGRIGATILRGLCLLIFVVFLVEGHRNLMLFMGLSFVGVRNYGKTIRLPMFALSLLICTMGFYMIGIVRNWGWTQLNAVTIGESAMDPLHGELGASYSVYEKLSEGSADRGLLFGSTYSTDFLINLVPQQLWRGRPASPAVQFSQTYFGTESLTSGLGFSPLIEAIINFSTYGISFVFAVTTLIFIALDTLARQAGRVGVLISAVLLPTVVNWNRIDCAACGKMFLVYCALIWFLDRLLYKRPNVARHSEPGLVGVRRVVPDEYSRAQKRVESVAPVRPVGTIAG